MRRFGWMILVAVLVRAAAPQQEPSVFRVGTHLVEIDVVVRDKNGPVTGLTKDDFTVFDCKAQYVTREQAITFGLNTSWCKDKRQAIQVFHAPGTSEPAALATRTVLPPGAVSNRVDSRGAAIDSTTVLLLDQLNVSFDHKEYARTQAIKFLKSLRESDRIAIYSLGKNLHVLQDFTDDPKKLVDAVSNFDSGLDALQAIPGDPSLYTPPPLTKTGDAVTDAFIAKMEAGADAVNPAILSMFDEITVEAVRKIVQHMSGIPGRKNLVWIKESPVIPPKALLLLRAANIAVYPVLVRSLQTSGVLNGRGIGRGIPMGIEFTLQHAASDLGASTGGAGFGDARDIAIAVSRAEEDSGSAYLLGFYPSTDDLDGKLHSLNVVLSRKFSKAGLELTFRRQYLATTQPTDSETGTLSSILENPLNATAIGLTAVATPDPEPGVFHLEITVNLADVQLRQQGDRWIGTLKTAVQRDVPNAKGVIVSSEPFVLMQPVNLSEEQFQARATSGLIVRQKWTGLGTAGGSLRVVIQDQANGAAGSLRVPLGKIKE